MKDRLNLFIFVQPVQSPKGRFLGANTVAFLTATVSPFSPYQSSVCFVRLKSRKQIMIYLKHQWPSYPFFLVYWIKTWSYDQFSPEICKTKCCENCGAITYSRRDEKRCCLEKSHLLSCHVDAVIWGCCWSCGSHLEIKYFCSLKKSNPYFWHCLTARVTNFWTCISVGCMWGD